MRCWFLIPLLVHVAVAGPPGVVIDHSPQTSGKYIGSPSIAVLPDGSYIATHDCSDRNRASTERATTRVFRSADKARRGRTSPTSGARSGAPCSCTAARCT